MKSALCLSGHLRTFDKVYPYIRDMLIGPMNCDVFIHTWDQIGAPTKKNRGDVSNSKTDTYKYAQLIRNTYNPKKLTIESQDDFNGFKLATNDIQILPEEKQYVMGHVANHVAMFYSIYESNKLKSEYEKSRGFVYDYVIRCRPDVRFGVPVTTSLLAKKDVVYVPTIGTYCTDGMNDQFAVSSSDLMDKYSDLYPAIISYYRDHVTTSRPESILRYHCKRQGLTIEPLPISYDVYRLDGEILRQHEWKAEILPTRWK